MERIITVKGTGAVSVAPDCIVLTLELETKGMTYEAAMTKAAMKIEQLQKAVTLVGFQKEEIKTTAFNVNVNYESRKNAAGDYRRVFAGYSCTQNLKLSFDFDSRRLSNVLAAVSDCGADPELDVRFTVKRPDEVGEALLQDAARNARKKAEVLCAASGVQLGELVSIDYNWGELDVYSRTTYEVDRECMAAPSIGCAAPDIEPDDIDVQDTVTFRWEIR